MIEGKTILCFASGYDAPPTSKHHVMHILAEQNVVLWINYHASRTPTTSSSDLNHIFNKLGEIIRGMQRPRQNLFVLTPLVLPLPGSVLAKHINRFLLINQIRLALTRIRLGPTQIWSFTPDISYLLGHFGEEKVVYYCVDDHASFSGYDRRQVLRDEQELCQKSDLVITTSLALQKAKSPWNPNTMLVPHGVDYEHFSRAMREDLLCPADLAAIPRPRLGFFGLIRDWVDLDLLAEVARARPHWHFVMIGDADSNVNIDQYRRLPNMHFLGRRAYEDLPAYCRHFDVGLIPFKINELTRAVNPIKLREYLAAGLPVISTPMPEVAQYNDLVEIVNSNIEFEKAATRCLSYDESENLKQSIEMAQEGWIGKLDLIGERLLDNVSSADLKPIL